MDKGRLESLARHLREQRGHFIQEFRRTDDLFFY